MMSRSMLVDGSATEANECQEHSLHCAKTTAKLLLGSGAREGGSDYNLQGSLLHV